MFSSKTATMKPLLESTSGVHLTAYIRNRGDLSDLKNQVRDAVELAEEHLSPVMTPNEISHFLAPLRLFQADGKRLRSFSGSIGVFRTAKSFRVINLPVEVEASCFVADTFHIKPLLKWMQLDREFLLLGMESGSASLYRGDMNTLKHVDTVMYPDCNEQQKSIYKTMEWLNGWIMNLTSMSKPRLFVAGKADLTRPFFQMLQYENIFPTPVWHSFSPEKTGEIGSQIRSILRIDAKRCFERALVEFHYALNVNQAKVNVFAIAKAAVQGRIKKLLIADGVQIFGKLNRRSGVLKLNGRDLDHEDDDILDDIAQAVLAHGGEVTVATRSEIPSGRPILAIMDNPPQPEVSQKHVADRDSQVHQERIAI